MNLRMLLTLLSYASWMQHESNAVELRLRDLAPTRGNAADVFIERVPSNRARAMNAEQLASHSSKRRRQRQTHPRKRGRR